MLSVLWKKIPNIFLIFFLAGLQLSQANAQDAEEIAAINKQVEQLYWKGDYAKATALAEKSLQLAQEALDDDDEEMVDSYGQLGTLYYLQAKHDEAEQLLTKALEVALQVLGENHPDTLTCASNLGMVYKAQGRYDEAEEFLTAAMEARIRTAGGQDGAVIESLNNLGTLYYEQARFDEATEFLERALKIAKDGLGAEHPFTLQTLNNLGMLYLHRGRFAEAEPLLMRAFEERKRLLGQQHPSLIESIHNLAVLKIVQGQDRDAEPLNKLSLAMSERVFGKDHPSTLQIISDLATLYSRLGQYLESAKLFKRVLGSKMRTLGSEHPSTLETFNHLGELYLHLGRDKDAEEIFTKALDSFADTLGDEHTVTLAAMQNLATVYIQQKRFDKAEQLLKRAWQSQKAVLGENHPAAIRTQSKLGEALFYQGRVEEAEKLFEDALRRSESVFGKEHPETLFQAGNNLAALHFIKKDWAKAAKIWQDSALALVKRTHINLHDVGRPLIGKGKNEAERNVDWFTALIKAEYRLASEHQAQAENLAKDSFIFSQFGRNSASAKSLAQMAARGAKGNKELEALVRERQDLIAHWQKLDEFYSAQFTQAADKRNEKLEAKLSARLGAVSQRIAEIDKKLAADFPEYAQLANPQALKIEDVQAELSEDEAVVLFLDTPAIAPVEEESFVWVVTKNDFRWVRSELGSTKLALEVLRLRCGLDRTAWKTPLCTKLTGIKTGKEGYPKDKSLPFNPSFAHGLYKSLFGGVEDLIKDKHLLIVPSGALTVLPFHVLVTKPPKSTNPREISWLIRDHAVTVLPAISSLKTLRRHTRPSTATKPLVGIGNPLLDGPDKRHAKRAELARRLVRCGKEEQPTQEQVAANTDPGEGVSLAENRSGITNVAFVRRQTPLPETAYELCWVADHVGAAPEDILLGPDATETRFKAMSESGALAQYKIVHFSTHGAMAGQMTGSYEPGLILTPPKEATRQDDGYLTASEIASLRLDAEWVILSACNTAAGGSTSAEALSGLARAFIYAQARSLLVSHWAVGSIASVRLITLALAQIGKDGAIGRAEPCVAVC